MTVALLIGLAALIFGAGYVVGRVVSLPPLEGPSPE